MLQFCQKGLTKIIQNVHTFEAFEARHDMLSFSTGPNKQNYKASVRDHSLTLGGTVSLYG